MVTPLSPQLRVTLRRMRVCIPSGLACRALLAELVSEHLPNPGMPEHLNEQLYTQLALQCRHLARLDSVAITGYH